eukprot:GHUV01005541.1.p1 GENE.GHUV01005541.1~~GHUV01005541.1.p1  ORF type:complete len:329 (+),score=43.88 GHUV01005541.1:427-1413(+)
MVMKNSPVADGRFCCYVVAVCVASFWAGRLSVRPAGLEMVHISSSASAPTSLTARESLVATTVSTPVAAKPPHSTAFYVPPAASHFRVTAESMKPVTDKVTAHAYDAMYSQYFELMGNKRMEPLKILEIGLGCDMNYGPGASAQVWRKYLPNADIWFAEIDGNCVNAHQAALDKLRVRAVVGEQSQPATLRQWINQTGGQFDVIIDDGGHTNPQIYNSFLVLFHEALKPGGAYFIEDLQVSRHINYLGTGPVMADVIRDWIDSLLRAVSFKKFDNLHNSPGTQGIPTEPPQRHPLPQAAKSVHCFAEACVVLKCTTDDARCPVGAGFS